MSKAYVILTDSGDIQEEAPSLGKPVFVMRETSERLEAVEVGIIKLVGVDNGRIVNEISKLIENANIYADMTRTHNPYRDGKAYRRIVDALLKNFHKN